MLQQRLSLSLQQQLLLLILAQVLHKKEEEGSKESRDVHH
jgi:hypothetical protein